MNEPSLSQIEDLNPVFDHKVSTTCHHSFSDATCYLMDFIGVPIEGETSTVGQNIKVGIIDSAEQTTDNEMDFSCFTRRPTERIIHDCEGPARLSTHGVICASIIAGKLRKAEFCDSFKMNEKIRWTVPSADLFTYILGCRRCKKTVDWIRKAFDNAISDKVDIISMSQSISGFRSKTFKEDSIGNKTLEAFQADILTCLPAGNNGPLTETANYGMPWEITTGACTHDCVLETIAEVGIIGDLPSGITEFRTEKDGDEEIKIFLNIKGVSHNLIEYGFGTLSFNKKPNGQEGVLFQNKTPKATYFQNVDIQHRKYLKKIQPTECPLTIISKDDSEHLWKLSRGMRGTEFRVRILRSIIRSDKRGTFIPEFSARGPSYLYQDNIVPDLVAPCCIILASSPTDIPMLPKVPLYANQILATGTSMACPHVAGAAAYVKSQHPEWSPSALKSALITTAKSLAAEKIPGNGFSFGAGLIQPKHACEPGLVFEETSENFEEYRDGQRSIHQLNLATFAASFAPSHEISSRIFLRKVRYVGDHGKVTYTAHYQKHCTRLDSQVSIEAVPAILTFENKDETKDFQLVVKVRPHSLGYISAALTWHPEDEKCSRDVVCPIILYQQTDCDRAMKYETNQKPQQKNQG